MKIIIFTHGEDIDGLGAAVLGRLVYGDENTEIRLLDAKTKDPIFMNEYYKNEFKCYDKIFIVDICPSNTVLKFIKDNPSLSNKIQILDHHVDSQKDFSEEYNFAHFEYKNDKGLVCGTAMFYEYLKTNGLLKGSKAIDEFVELIRQYDTWEWKTIYNNEKAHELSLLMDATGKEAFIELTLENIKKDSFEFTETEKIFIENLKEKMAKYVANTAKNMITIDMDGAKIGVIFAEEYRNDIKEYILSLNTDLDCIAIFKLNSNTVSWRAIKDGFNVIPLARKYGGGGIVPAAGSRVTKEDLLEITKTLLKIK